MPDRDGRPDVVPANGCPHYVTRKRAAWMVRRDPHRPVRCIWCEMRPVVPQRAGRRRARHQA